MNIIDGCLFEKRILFIHRSRSHKDGCGNWRMNDVRTNHDSLRVQGSAGKSGTRILRKRISETHTRTSPNFLCMLPIWQWCGPALAALRFFMYFRFSGWRHFSIMGPVAQATQNGRSSVTHKGQHGFHIDRSVYSNWFTRGHVVTGAESDHSDVCDRERKCADTVGTVLVPWAGHSNAKI